MPYFHILTRKKSQQQSTKKTIHITTKLYFTHKTWLLLCSAVLYSLLLSHLFYFCKLSCIDPHATAQIKKNHVALYHTNIVDMKRFISLVWWERSDQFLHQPHMSSFSCQHTKRTSHPFSRLSLNKWTIMK